MGIQKRGIQKRFPMGEAQRRPQRVRQQRKEKDPYLYILNGQIALCLLLSLLAFAVKEARPVFLEPMRTQYERLLVDSRFSAGLFAGGTATQTVANEYAALRDHVEETLANWIERLISPRDTSTPPENADFAQKKESGVPQQEIPARQAVSSAVMAAQTAALSQGGMGGWFSAKKEDARIPPDSCTFSPIILSVPVDTPTDGWVSSFYGWRQHPITDKDDFHRGIDIAAAAGSGVYTPLPGRVAEVSESSIYGNYVTIDHGGGIQTTYCHCSEIVAVAGENLRRGELVARVGSTGVSTGPHVHFEISKDGVYYNPAWVMRQLSSYVH